MIENQQSQRIKPLRSIVEAYLRLHEMISLRAILLGVDPANAPSYLKNSKSSWFNRSTLVDIHAMFWPLLDYVMLVSVGKSFFGRSPLTVAITVGIIAAYRLNELIGGVLWVLTKRVRDDYADPRKMALTLLIYFEPIVLFAILHGVASLLWSNGEVGGGYSLGGRPWNWATMIHYSLGCYTTVGWGDVSSTSQPTMILSDVETLVGVLMLAFTISVFVSRAVSGQEKKHTSTETQT